MDGMIEIKPPKEFPKEFETLEIGIHCRIRTDITDEYKTQHFHLGLFCLPISEDVANHLWNNIPPKLKVQIIHGLLKDYKEYKDEANIDAASAKNGTKKVATPGWIYLIKSKNLHKIGRAKNIKDRIKTYRTENPFGIKVIFQYHVGDYIKAENYFLDKFKSKQVKGEWFKLNKEDIKEFRADIPQFFEAKDG